MAQMKAKDTLFISSVSSENIPPGGKFEVSDEQAARLEKKGFATRIGGAKASPAHENKMEPAPANKAEKPPMPAPSISAKRKRGK